MLQLEGEHRTISINVKDNKVFPSFGLSLTKGEMRNMYLDSFPEKYSLSFS